jgi:hypothetical protein
VTAAGLQLGADSTVMVSMGITGSGGSLAVGGTSRAWVTPNGTGNSALAGNQTLASKTNYGSGASLLDVRLEYEAFTNADYGFFVGDFITIGYGDGDLAASQKCSITYENWPGAAGLRRGFVYSNAGVGGSNAIGDWNVSNTNRIETVRASVCELVVTVGFG